MSSRHTTTTVTDDQGDSFDVDLKDRYLAAFLAWLVPGLGHLYQRRIGKGTLFLVCILGTFLFGLAIGNGRVVYYSSNLDRFQKARYFAQACVGVTALPALMQNRRVMQGKPPLISDNFMRPPYERHYPPFKPGFGLQDENKLDLFETTDHVGKKVTQPNELSLWHYELGSLFELGTTFTVIAGMLNVLAIFDAFAGPMITLPTKKK